MIEKSNLLTLEKRARITEIQDLLIERYVEKKQKIRKNNKIRTKEIEFEIKKLKREMEEIEEWPNV